MWALVKDGSVDIVYGGATAVTIDGISHPKEIFTLWSEAERKAINVYDIVRKTQPDWNFYTVSDSTFVYNAGTDTVNETFNITEKNVDNIKVDLTESTNAQGMGRIGLYDWLTSRYIFDNTKAIPSAVKTYVAAVRSHCATICSAIDGCSDLAAFKVVHAKIYADDGEYNTGWPDESGVKEYERI